MPTGHGDRNNRNPQDGRVMTLAECAAALHLSHQRVRQLEASGLKRAREYLESKGLDAEALLPVLLHSHVTRDEP